MGAPALLRGPACGRARAALCGLVLAAASPGIAAAPSAEAVRAGTPHEALFAIDLAGAQGLAVGAAGALLESQDGGTSWAAATTPSEGRALLGVHQHGARALAVGQEGVVLRRAAQGGWRKIDAGTRERLFSVHLNADGLAVITGAFGTILLSSDGGEQWTPIAPSWPDFVDGGQDPHLYVAHIDAQGRITVAGEFGLILRSDDRGASWRLLRRGAASIFALDLHQAGRDSYAVGQVGTLLHSADGGESWATRASGSSANLLSVKAAPAGTVVIAGFRENLVSADGGHRWQALTDERFGTLWFAGVAGGEDGAGLLLAGQAGLILRLRP